MRGGHLSQCHVPVGSRVVQCPSLGSLALFGVEVACCVPSVSVRQSADQPVTVPSGQSGQRAAGGQRGGYEA